jgi:hypothetical protein
MRQLDAAFGLLRQHPKIAPVRPPIPADAYTGVPLWGFLRSTAFAHYRHSDHGSPPGSTGDSAEARAARRLTPRLLREAIRKQVSPSLLRLLYGAGVGRLATGDPKAARSCSPKGEKVSVDDNAPFLSLGNLAIRHYQLTTLSLTHTFSFSTPFWNESVIIRPDEVRSRRAVESHDAIQPRLPAAQRSPACSDRHPLR